MIRKREEDGRKVVYSPISGLMQFDVTGDYNDPNVIYSSVEKRTDNDGKNYFGIYNFQQAGIDRTLTLRLTYDGSMRYVHSSGKTDAAPDSTLQFLTRDSSGNPKTSYDSIAIIAPNVPATQVSGLYEEISSVVHDLSTETDVLSILQNDLQVEPILSAKLSSHYWIVGGTYNKNCYGKSIGDSNKIMAISLNGRSLYGMGTGLALDWDSRIAYD